MSQQQKVVLVTGGGTGIGRAVSLELARRGACVVVNYARSRSEAEETATMIRDAGGEALAIQADVADDAAVRDMIARTIEAYGRLDWLVNNAGITRHIPLNDLESVTDDVWEELIGVNVKGMFHCARAAAPYLKQSEAGAIVNLGSIAGSTGLGSSLPYAVSKSAVHGLTKSLARAMAPEVRVNCIAPGAVETRWWSGREAQMRKLGGHLPLQRVSTAEEIAAMIAAVLEQPAITGQTITVDSGQTM
ncbi:3-oxoacyl-[acyl-carrier protein] reductase [Paenibacillus phyllosphaerae]|uniref:3-oxoacyl-[acyl-carrier protein] reductase n=1 Tax=Paenibacillus phyllosphaerae TaxID=274593 RepID=A0A7W5FMH3_9BACL|nr:SDR family NAD(P)-dependent oxidoreductase [Paenibacillus phyllosphaerae]MBB3110275.1 3-oxoacyl-[acyl-carrier protein] reductase [Paenibacillus phyllosphaerae]